MTKAGPTRDVQRVSPRRHGFGGSTLTFSNVTIGQFSVADVTYDQAVALAADLAVAPTYPKRFYALHVGGLNARADPEFVQEMNDADLVCADGGSIVWLGRLAGSRSMERVPTTDAGWDVLRAIGARLARKPRVALIGARPEIVKRASSALAEGVPCDVVLVEHGFHQEWTDVLSRLRRTRPDVLVLGLGAPREMLWVREYRGHLPPCLIMTCGGWFGFLSGEEARAPVILRRTGLEWIARVAQSPRRLLPRYLQGTLSTALVGANILKLKFLRWW